jgi:hypothetical protein
MNRLICGRWLCLGCLWGLGWACGKALAEGAQVEQRVLVNGSVRVFYFVHGKHKVESADNNHNAVPDQVEDLMKQTEAARRLFVEVLGFPDPFKSERFAGVRYLDIHLRHRDVLKANGVAYDELQRFNRAGDPEGTLSLCFNVATSVQPSRNLTPAHEYFHLIQSGATYFKNRWFTEGMARWSERGLGLGGLGPTKPLAAWPLTADSREALFGMAYDAAEAFWNPLVAGAGEEEVIPDTAVTQELRALRYTDGKPVLADLKLTGWRWMRRVLNALAEADDRAFAELGYTSWTEGNQRSPQNSRFILETQAVEQAVEQAGH